MAVFAQERHAIEHEPEWEQVRASRDAFEAILARLLAGRRPRPTGSALRPARHGQPHRDVGEPGGPAERRADRRRLLRHAAAVIRDADEPRDRPRPPPADEPALRALDHARWSYALARSPARRSTSRSRSTACSSPSATDEIAGYVKLGRHAGRWSPSRHVREIKGLAVSPAHPAPAASAARCWRPRSRGARRRRAQGHPARARPQRARPRPLRSACGFEVEGVLRGLFLLDGTLRRRRPDVARPHSRRLDQRRRDGLRPGAARSAAPCSRRARAPAPAG